MNKILPLAVVCFLVLSGLGAVALPEFDHKQLEKIESISFSTPYTQDKGNYISLHLDESNANIMESGKPMLPIYTKVIELPFGVKNINVFCTIKGVHEEDIFKEIVPTPEAVPLVAEKIESNDILVDETVYSSTDLYPQDWHSFRVVCGLNSANEHVTYVAVHVYPVRYSPGASKLYYIESVEIKVTYDMPTELVTFADTYDLVVIAPKKFSRGLKRLVDHKNKYGVPTVFKSVEDIYNENTGVDKPEQIKYFIKDAIEEWNIKYVLLVGGLKRYWNNDDRDNDNEGSTDWHVPVRYTNLYDSEDMYDPGFISDLYYADVYKAGGLFENWDSNGDGIFAAWDKPGVSNDVLDLYPDVCVGRLACRNRLEVMIMVNKIINYEKTPANPSWFNKMVCVAGDSFPSDFLYEGEATCDAAIDFMTDFEPIRIYASNRDSGEGLTPSPENITDVVSNGCGFLMFEGHGTPAAWGTKYPGAEEWTPFFTILHIPKLSNRKKLPICVVGGCHNSLFNVSIYKTYGPQNESYWTQGWPAPECFSWWLTRKIGGGSIATIGCTALSYGFHDGIGLSAYLDILFFWAYGEMGEHVLGEAWSTAVNEYLFTFGGFFKLDAKTVQEWVLLGDPSLMIGGYS